MSRVVITGSAGVIGSVLMSDLQGVEVVPFDLPEMDALSWGDLDRTLVGADAVVHLAWDTKSENFKSKSIDQDNSRMLLNVFESALRNGVRRVVFASSIHADVYPDIGRNPRARTDETPVPGSLYGADKVFGEAMARYFAALGLETVAVRFGGVSRRDVPPASDSIERAVFLSHRDCVSLVQRCIDANDIAGNYACVNAVSDNKDRWHDLDNPFGWAPQDSDTRRLTEVSES